MYQYSDFDQQFVNERVNQFRKQVERRITGSLTEEEFKPLRLMNGLYLQLHAYMLRVAIPYGTLNANQMRRLALIAERWDKGYGHFTTRQNIQFNWPKLQDIPDILQSLAEVQMHAIQTSGNTIRNVTTDHFAGAAADEIEDPRPTAELIRQWSTDHPEFQFLPRKFKIAITGSPNDRAVTKAHDIGLRMVKDKDSRIGYEVIVGGGLGRTPMIGKVINEFIAKADLLPYLQAVLRVYNRFGRRDNKYKARIKILIHEQGLEKIQAQVNEEFSKTKQEFIAVDEKLLAQIQSQFDLPAFKTRINSSPDEQSYSQSLKTFIRYNVFQHKNNEHCIVTVSLKKIGATPGDATAQQMRGLAEIAEKFAYGELRISHEQNIILPHVHKTDLSTVYNMLAKLDLASANIGLISDIIACPGMDYCALATARSIPIAKQIAQHFDALDLSEEIGQLKIKISGCINACGHHHVGHIGILGLEKAGVENYQITLGGDHSENAAIAKRIGPGFSADELILALERLLRGYLSLRNNKDESFIETYKRLGSEPFKAEIYKK